MKVCVYAIAKNESKFVDRFIESCKDADVIVIADTGSTDSTLEMLRKHEATNPKVRVSQITVSPWRFDDARNVALSLVPADVDVCLSIDLDEVLVEGWRTSLESEWVDGTTRGRYFYVWSWKDDKPANYFYTDKIHSRYGYHWKYPCHEILVPNIGTTESRVELSLKVHHFPDSEKSRGQYRDLLKLGVDLYPDDPRSLLYYGRELTFHNEPVESIYYLRKYLECETNVWNAERSYARSLIAKNLMNTDIADAIKEGLQAVAEDPTNHNAWMVLASIYKSIDSWMDVLWACDSAMRYPCGDYYFIDPIVRGSYFPHLASVACHALGFMELGTKHAIEALHMEPTSEVLRSNLKYFGPVPPSAKPPMMQSGGNQFKSHLFK